MHGWVYLPSTMACCPLARACYPKVGWRSQRPPLKPMQAMATSGGCTMTALTQPVAFSGKLFSSNPRQIWSSPCTATGLLAVLRASMEDTFTTSSKRLDGTTHRGANRSFVASQCRCESRSVTHLNFMGRTARKASHNASTDLRAGDMSTNLMNAGPSGPVRLSKVVQRDGFCYALLTGHF